MTDYFTTEGDPIVRDGEYEACEACEGDKLTVLLIDSTRGFPIAAMDNDGAMDWYMHIWSDKRSLFVL